MEYYLSQLCQVQSICPYNLGCLPIPTDSHPPTSHEYVRTFQQSNKLNFMKMICGNSFLFDYFHRQYPYAKMTKELDWKQNEVFCRSKT